MGGNTTWVTTWSCDVRMDSEVLQFLHHWTPWCALSWNELFSVRTCHENSLKIVFLMSRGPWKRACMGNSGNCLRLTPVIADTRSRNCATKVARVLAYIRDIYKQKRPCPCQYYKMSHRISFAKGMPHVGLMVNSWTKAKKLNSIANCKLQGKGIYSHRIRFEAVFRSEKRNPKWNLEISSNSLSKQRCIQSLPKLSERISDSNGYRLWVMITSPCWIDKYLIYGAFVSH